MATKAPRIAVTLAPETFHIVSRLAAVKGQPRSSIVAELVEEMAPGLEQLATVGEYFRQLDAGQKEALAEAVRVSEEKVAAPLMSALGAIEDMQRGMDEVLGGLEPPPSNTGVRSDD